MFLLARDNASWKVRITGAAEDSIWALRGCADVCPHPVVARVNVPRKVKSRERPKSIALLRASSSQLNLKKYLRNKPDFGCEESKEGSIGTLSIQQAIRLIAD
jgi:hypothetical protein